MNRSFFVGVTLLLVEMALEPARATTLFYGGDWYASGSGTATSTNMHRSDLKSTIFQSFTVPVGQTWNVKGLFSNDLVGPAPSIGITVNDIAVFSQPVPGPGSLVLAALGLIGVATFASRRRKAR